MARIKANWEIVASIFALIFFCETARLQASPRDDLASSSQSTRDAAAKIVRENYTPPPRTNWEALAASLKLGTLRSIVDAQLQSSNFEYGGSYSVGATDIKMYQLDHLWSLRCMFTNGVSGSTNKPLAEVDLDQRLRDIWVEPPTNFTGIWTTYWANGQRCYETHYKNSVRDGELVLYAHDGTKSVVSHFFNGRSEGEESGFYPSGRIRYKGQHTNDQQSGHWVWYNEDGTIESEKDYGANNPSVRQVPQK